MEAANTLHALTRLNLAFAVRETVIVVVATLDACALESAALPLGAVLWPRTLHAATIPPIAPGTTIGLVGAVRMGKALPTNSER